MNQKVIFAVLLIVGSAVLFGALKYGVIGIRGGSTDRSANPLAFWIAVIVLCIGLIGCLLALVIG